MVAHLEGPNPSQWSGPMAKAVRKSITKTNPGKNTATPPCCAGAGAPGDTGFPDQDPRQVQRAKEEEGGAVMRNRVTSDNEARRVGRSSSTLAVIPSLEREALSLSAQLSSLTDVWA